MAVSQARASRIFSVPEGRWGWLKALVRVGIPFAALLVDGVTAAIAVVVAQEAALWLARRLTNRPETAVRLFCGAYAIRAMIAIPIHLVRTQANGNGAVFQDDYVYDLVGDWLARIARGDPQTLYTGHRHALDGMYPYLLAQLYFLTGHAPLLPKLINCGLAGLCAVLVFDMGRRALGQSAALMAGVVAAVLPTLVIWSLVTLKETLILLVILLALRAILQLAVAPLMSSQAANAWLLFIGSTGAVADLREPVAGLLVVLLGGVLLARLSRRVPAWQIASGLGAAAALALVIIVGVHIRNPDSSLSTITDPVLIAQSLSERRGWEALRARSQLDTGADLSPASSNPTDNVVAQPPTQAADASLTSSLTFALFAPAPWQATSLRDLAASLEMPFWYLLLAGSLFAWLLPPRRTRLAVILGCYAVGIWLVLAVAEGNVGNLLRHRIMLEPPILILGIGGLMALAERFHLHWPRALSGTQRPSKMALSVDGPGASVRGSRAGLG